MTYAVIRISSLEVFASVENQKATQEMVGKDATCDPTELRRVNALIAGYLAQKTPVLLGTHRMESGFVFLRTERKVRKRSRRFPTRTIPPTSSWLICMNVKQCLPSDRVGIVCRTLREGLVLE